MPPHSKHPSLCVRNQTYDAVRTIAGEHLKASPTHANIITAVQSRRELFVQSNKKKKPTTVPPSPKVAPGEPQTNTIKPE